MFGSDYSGFCVATADMACIAPEDNGGSVEVFVPAYPGLAADGVYVQPEQGQAGGNEALQTGVWSGPRVRTNGSQLSFSIRGKWQSSEMNDDASGRYCMNAESGDKTVIGDKGQISYVDFSRSVERDGNGDLILNAMLDLEPVFQRDLSCSLIGGEGLYIGFFGPNGNEMPDVATHLRAVNIYCDPQYRHINDSGYYSMEGCYDNETRENMAYFKGTYDSSNAATSFPYCPDDFLHGSVAKKNIYRNAGVLYTDMCWSCDGNVTLECPSFGNLQPEASYSLSQTDRNAGGYVLYTKKSGSYTSGADIFPDNLEPVRMCSPTGSCIQATRLTRDGRSVTGDFDDGTKVTIKYPVTNNDDENVGNFSKRVVTINESSSQNVRIVTRTFEGKENYANGGLYVESIRNTCDEGKKIAVCKGEKTDMTEFIYNADYFFKKASKERAQVNEMPKFMIYDNWYSDNSGGYTLNLRNGFFNNGEGGGIIEWILTDIESIFVGRINEQGVREGGILREFYERIVRDSEWTLVVKSAMTIYVALVGWMFFLGMLKWELKEYMTILWELVFVFSFTSYFGWEYYNEFVVKFFLEGVADIMMFFAHTAINTFTDVEYNPGYGMSLSRVFGFVDTYITSMFTRERSVKIWGMFFGLWYGFIAIPVVYYLIVKFILEMVNATFPFIISFIQVVIALIIGPVIIFLYLFKFKPTKKYLSSWIAFIGGRFINMTFLFVFINMFAAIIRQRIDELTGVCACKWKLWDAIARGQTSNGAEDGVRERFSLNMRPWVSQYRDTPNILEFAIGVLGILILILIFNEFLSKLPTIVDSMVDIGGEAGGGLDPMTQTSRMGGGLSKAFGGSMSGGFSGFLQQVKTREWDAARGAYKDTSIGKQIDARGGVVAGLLNKANESAGEMFHSVGVGSGKSLTSQLSGELSESVGRLKENVSAYFDPGVDRQKDALAAFNQKLNDRGNLMNARDAAIESWESSFNREHGGASDERKAEEKAKFVANLDNAILSRCDREMADVRGRLGDDRAVIEYFNTGMYAFNGDAGEGRDLRDRINERLINNAHNGDEMRKKIDEYKRDPVNLGARETIEREDLVSSLSACGIDVDPKDPDPIKSMLELEKTEEGLLKSIRRTPTGREKYTEEQRDRLAKIGLARRNWDRYYNTLKDIGGDEGKKAGEVAKSAVECRLRQELRSRLDMKVAQVGDGETSEDTYRDRVKKSVNERLEGFK
ncbi:MAG: hypothetical protein LBH46_01990, partial [Rickettsiales bacterium]|nr:hypothetical protein [Rickettsiales bacterium]